MKKTPLAFDCFVFVFPMSYRSGSDCKTGYTITLEEETRFQS